jgi:hypothetical protein
VIAKLSTPDGDSETFLGDPVGDRYDLELEWIIPGG